MTTAIYEYHTKRKRERLSMRQFRALPGADPVDAMTEAVEFAGRMNETIVLTCDGTDVVIRPNDSVANAGCQWDRNRDANRSEA